MKNSSSECSSRRESGWTMYFDQSSNYGDQFYKADDKDFRSKVANVKEDDEDLSMVSDASSGPPQFCEDEGCFDETRYFGYASSAYEQAKKGEKKKKTKERRGKKQHSYLDDTASSPVLRFSEKDIAFSSNEASKGFSETRFKGKSSSSEAASGLQGRKRG
ncbi:protein SOB FIVE-LIKE 5-like isoform X2 [Cornus florida]|uniref:protein SOB FIVE-LIKE 5-like isoform X2 n=1 Tax=Cornus florida TaxID=4283 RepID=UPI00289B8E14|nr:protein SOB FIVE-LIKE 5-like isoform X2 [Cornus florida]